MSAEMGAASAGCWAYLKCSVISIAGSFVQPALPAGERYGERQVVGGAITPPEGWRLRQDVPLAQPTMKKDKPDTSRTSGWAATRFGVSVSVGAGEAAPVVAGGGELAGGGIDVGVAATSGVAGGCAVSVEVAPLVADVAKPTVADERTSVRTATPPEMARAAAIASPTQRRVGDQLLTLAHAVRASGRSDTAPSKVRQ